MTLVLNEPGIGDVYKDYYGQNNYTLNRLIRDGRNPLSVSEILERRVTSHLPDWKHNYFDTSDAFVYHPDGNFKVVLDAEPLRNLNIFSNLSSGGLVLPDGMYESLEGVEIKRGQMETRIDLSKTQVMGHPVWNALVRDRGLLEAYTDNIFSEMGSEYGYDAGMSVVINFIPELPILRSALIFGLIGNKSGINGMASLEDPKGRIVGKR